MSPPRHDRRHDQRQEQRGREGRGDLRVGCSGWSYDDWRGRVYPAGVGPADWLGRYASLFDTVEINATFYRLPEATTVRQWAAGVPDHFCFAVKVGQFGSHRKKLREPETWLPRHVERISDLGDHLGPNLLQLPPNWRRDCARLDEFLEAAPNGWRWAVELRDSSWLHDDVFDVLARHRSALVLHDLLPDHPMVRTAPWTYLRFHGPRAIADPYRGRYGPDRLAPLAERLAAWLDEGTDVFAYFNNDFDAHAPSDARWLRRALGVAPPVGPVGDTWPTPPNWVPWSDDHEPTRFQAQVVAAVAGLSPHELVTYGDIAEEISRPGGGQAVANTLRHAPDVPWWRVVPADGRIYRSHEPTQRPLLEDEGHVIDADRRIVGPGRR